jgi:protein-disulfide isomerase/mono/diheme cytochrome c family protein
MNWTHKLLSTRLISRVSTSFRLNAFITSLVAFCLIITLQGVGVQYANAAERWYGDEQVGTGKALFIKSCAQCHGSEAQGTTNWKKRDEHGFLPPPPLNGTAHAWHHSIDILKRTIREGGSKLGGKMPGFGSKFTDAEQNAIISYFQSKWSDEVYDRWAEVYSNTIPLVSEAIVLENDSNPISLDLLHKLLPDADISDFTKTPTNELLRVKVDGHYAYVTRDGRYALIGSLMDLSTGTDFTELARQADRAESIESFPLEDMIIYPANGLEKSIITVFIDTACLKCRALHKEITSLQDTGTTVRYIAYPRGGSESITFDGMRAIWCEKDRWKAVNIAMGFVDGTLGDGKCRGAVAVEKVYRLGNEIGVRSVPSIVLEDGHMLPGHVSAGKLRSLLTSLNDGAQPN